MAVQSAHAAYAAALDHRNGNHPHFVVLSVPDEAKLLAEYERVTSKGVKASLFYEPDFSGGHHTAFATEPILGDKRKLFSNLPMMRFS